MAVKKEVFGKLDAIAKPGAILATNTSTLDVNEIAAATKRPGDVLGLHFFSPANIMRLLEIVRGKATADDALATAMAHAVGSRVSTTAASHVNGPCSDCFGIGEAHSIIPSLFLLQALELKATNASAHCCSIIALSAARASS